MATDPVCGMTVDPATAKHRFAYRGTEYLFCGNGCRVKFEAAPEKYLAPKSAPVMPSAPADSQTKPGTLYTCPMHPEVRRIGPGSCPKCGMALEPLNPTAGAAEDDSELRTMARRFWVSLALSVPTLALGMGSMIPGDPLMHILTMQQSAWAQLILATPVVSWGAAPFFARAWASLVHRSLNMFTLIGLGVGVAYLYSLVALLAPGLFPGGAPEVYFESAAVITTLVLLGQVLELRARAQTGGAIRALLNLAPKTARRVDKDGSEHDEPLDHIVAGDRLRVRPGDSVPVDGEIVEGNGTLDELMITGESLPVAKSRGDRVTGGTRNQDGSFVMTATRVGAETLLARIVQLVAEAQRSAAPVQRLADKVSAWFVPTVIAVACITFVIWLTVGPEPRLAHALVNAVAVLIIACPCALGLATPVSIMVGTGEGARLGILMHNAAALERMERVDTLIVDKTGTLTEGRPKVVDIVSLGVRQEDELLRLVAAIERGSGHPLAAAIVGEANARKLAIPTVTDFASETGQGVRGTAEGHEIRVGTAAYVGAEERSGQVFQQDGKMVIYIGVDGTAVGLIAIADPIKTSSRAALDALRNGGVEIIMATGDARPTAEAVGRALGITRIEAALRPEDKSRLIAELKAKGHVVAMAGDGINDAPALAAADIGIAMGTGTDIAIESAAITLVKGDLTGILRARRLSHRVMRNIRENLVFAFAYNCLGVPIAAGILYPVFGLALSPMIASAAMSLSSVSVIANALRLRAVRQNP